MKRSRIGVALILCYFTFSIFDKGIPVRSGKTFDQGQVFHSVDTRLGEEDAHDHCQSRVQHHLYRRTISQFTSSPHLISKLREYEQLHARCTKDLEANLLQILKYGNSTSNDCQYLVWRNYSGLGNKIMSIVSSFAYALLTNRILLIERGADMDKLFCEPFPESSWYLPENFPLQSLISSDCRIVFDQPSFCSRKNKELKNYGCFDLADMYDRMEMFFCDHQQELLRSQTDLLFVTANLYFLPSLFYVKSFRSELKRFFPQQEATFHLLSRYLLNPADAVWGRTVRYFTSYLSRADQVVGIQIRDRFDLQGLSNVEIYNKLLKCGTDNSLLPFMDRNHTGATLDRGDSVAVLVTSLDDHYYETLREEYVKFPTLDGERVAVFSPSNEKVQQTEKQDHDEKALMEMILLSFSDVLITSPGSTFGYVAHGMAGIQPWSLVHRGSSEQDPSNQTSCLRVTSIDPCFHAKVVYGCDCAVNSEAKLVQQNIQSCQDVPWGIQLK